MNIMSRLYNSWDGAVRICICLCRLVLGCWCLCRLALGGVGWDVGVDVFEILGRCLFHVSRWESYNNNNDFTYIVIYYYTKKM